MEARLEEQLGPYSLVPASNGHPHRIEAFLIASQVSSWSGEEGIARMAQAVRTGNLDYCSRIGGGSLFALVGRAWAIYLFEKARRLGGRFLEEWRGAAPPGALSEVMEVVRSLAPMNEVVILSNRRGLADFLAASDASIEVAQLEQFVTALETSGTGWKEWRNAGRGFLGRIGFERLYF